MTHDDVLIIFLSVNIRQRSIADGYQDVAKTYGISRSQARRYVHEALARDGVERHSRFWLLNEWKRRRSSQRPTIVEGLQ